MLSYSMYIQVALQRSHENCSGLRKKNRLNVLLTKLVLNIVVVCMYRVESHNVFHGFVSFSDFEAFVLYDGLRSNLCSI